MILTQCTMTGADNDVDPAALVAISRRFPFVEWAILFSFGRAGQPRYPSVDWIDEFAMEASRTGISTALHLCGKAVPAFLEGKSQVTGFADWFDRVQLNFDQSVEQFDIRGLRSLINRQRKPIITQHNAANAEIARYIDARRHQVLFDASGGQGIQSAEWPAYLPDKAHCGYAGGLGPANVAAELPRIASSAGNRTAWIDMESRIRTADDRFDLRAVTDVLEQVDAWMKTA